jgi:hypothetical protein
MTDCYLKLMNADGSELGCTTDTSAAVRSLKRQRKAIQRSQPLPERPYVPPVLTRIPAPWIGEDAFILVTNTDD